MCICTFYTTHMPGFLALRITVHISPPLPSPRAHLKSRQNLSKTLVLCQSPHPMLSNFLLLLASLELKSWTRSGVNFFCYCFVDPSWLSGLVASFFFFFSCRHVSQSYTCAALIDALVVCPVTVIKIKKKTYKSNLRKELSAHQSKG